MFSENIRQIFDREFNWKKYGCCQKKNRNFREKKYDFFFLFTSQITNGFIRIDYRNCQYCIFCLPICKDILMNVIYTQSNDRRFTDGYPPNYKQNDRNSEFVFRETGKMQYFLLRATHTHTFTPDFRDNNSDFWVIPLYWRVS